MAIDSIAILAGTASTVLFAASVLPMLVKAARTRDLTSYSRGNLVLANVGNAVHSVYVAQLPAGPIWALHSFYVLTSALMLISRSLMKSFGWKMPQREFLSVADDAATAAA